MLPFALVTLFVGIDWYSSLSGHAMSEVCCVHIEDCCIEQSLNSILLKTTVI